MRDTQEMASEPPPFSAVQPRYPVIVWLNLVCLDAPIVAVTWQWLFARSFHLPIAAPARLTLFLTAWLIYLADRLGDALSLRDGSEKSLRERFCQRHRGEWLVLLGSVTVLDAWIVFHDLAAHLLRVGLVVGLVAAVYLLVNYSLGKLWRALPVKEFSVGLLFAVGTVTAFLPRLEFGFWLAFSLFAALCSLNCISIAVWEKELDEAQHKHSIATRWPRTRRYLRLPAVLLAIICAICALSGLAPAEFCGAAGMSALLLGGLDFFRDQTRRDERTALADLVLLTPLILLLFAR